MIRWKRRSPKKIIAKVTVEGRRFIVTEERQSEDLQVGYVHPRCPQEEIAAAELPGIVLNMNSATSMRFKVFETNRGQRGYVTNVEVVPSKQRKGWATSMVKTLLQLYPECVWTVEAPNEESGQLFVCLANTFPDVVLPPLIDTRYAIDDPKRYTTRLNHV